MTRSVRVAMAQMRVDGGDVSSNLERASSMIRQAAERSAGLVVLPECLDVGWTHPSARTRAQPVPGPTTDALCAAARRAGICVAAGVTECVDGADARAEDADEQAEDADERADGADEQAAGPGGGRIFDTALLIDPTGGILWTHRKINILDIARDLYSVGDRLGVVRTPLGTIGLNICADNWMDSIHLGHALAAMGADLIVSPSAWAVPADHDNSVEPYGGDWIPPYTLLAKTHDMPVVGVSNVGWMTGGPWEGRRCIGNSLAVAAGGSIAARAPHGVDAEALVVVDLDLPRSR